MVSVIPLMYTRWCTEIVLMSKMVIFDNIKDQNQITKKVIYKIRLRDEFDDFFFRKNVPEVLNEYFGKNDFFCHTFYNIAHLLDINHILDTFRRGVGYLSLGRARRLYFRSAVILGFHILITQHKKSSSKIRATGYQKIQR